MEKVELRVAALERAFCVLAGTMRLGQLEAAVSELLKEAATADGDRREIALGAVQLLTGQRGR